MRDESGMRPDLLSLFESFYRTRQTSIAGILLAGKTTDLISALVHLCEKNHIPMEEGLEGQMDEVESMLKRIEDINDLPIQELLRLPPLELSPGTQHPFKSPGDATESGAWSPLLRDARLALVPYLSEKLVPFLLV